MSGGRRHLSGYFLAGAAAFAAAQALLFRLGQPTGRPTIDSEGWFLNSGTGIAMMAAALAAVALIVSRALPATLWTRWMLFAGGAVAALVAAVFLFGPGTIFPIVIAAGAAVIAIAALAGVVAARLLG